MKLLSTNMVHMGWVGDELFRSSSHVLVDLWIFLFFILDYVNLLLYSENKIKSVCKICVFDFMVDFF